MKRPPFIPRSVSSARISAIFIFRVHFKRYVSSELRSALDPSARTFFMRSRTVHHYASRECKRLAFRIYITFLNSIPRHSVRST